MKVFAILLALSVAISALISLLLYLLLYLPGRQERETACDTPDAEEEPKRQREQSE